MQVGFGFTGKVAGQEPGSSQQAVFPLWFLLHVPALASFKDRESAVSRQAHFLHKQLSVMVFIRVPETKLTYRGSGD